MVGVGQDVEGKKTTRVNEDDKQCSVNSFVENVSLLPFVFIYLLIT